MFNTVLIFVMVRLFKTIEITRNKLAGEKTLVFLIYIYIRNPNDFSSANSFVIIFIVSKSLTITNINTVLNIFVF